jgi:hypothetical protein
MRGSNRLQQPTFQHAPDMKRSHRYTGLQTARFTTQARNVGAFKSINDESRRVAKQPMRSGRFLTILAASSFAQAADNPTTSTATQTEQSGTSHIVASLKTRADVHHELVQAQRNGQLSSLSTLYRGR